MATPIFLHGSNQGQKPLHLVHVGSVNVNTRKQANSDLLVPNSCCDWLKKP